MQKQNAIWNIYVNPVHINVPVQGLRSVILLRNVKKYVCTPSPFVKIFVWT